MTVQNQFRPALAEHLAQFGHIRQGFARRYHSTDDGMVDQHDPAKPGLSRRLQACGQPRDLRLPEPALGQVDGGGNGR